MTTLGRLNRIDAGITKTSNTSTKTLGRLNRLDATKPKTTPTVKIEQPKVTPTPVQKVQTTQVQPPKQNIVQKVGGFLGNLLQKAKAKEQIEFQANEFNESIIQPAKQNPVLKPFISGVEKFGQTLGKAAASRQVKKTQDKINKEFKANQDIALKKFKEAKTIEEKQKWFNLLNQQQKVQNKIISNIEENYNKTAGQIIGEGLTTAFTAINPVGMLVYSSVTSGTKNVRTNLKPNLTELAKTKNVNKFWSNIAKNFITGVFNPESEMISPGQAVTDNEKAQTIIDVALIVYSLGKIGSKAIDKVVTNKLEQQTLKNILHTDVNTTIKEVNDIYKKKVFDLRNVLINKGTPKEIAEFKRLNEVNQIFKNLKNVDDASQPLVKVPEVKSITQGKIKETKFSPNDIEDSLNNSTLATVEDSVKVKDLINKAKTNNSQIIVNQNGIGDVVITTPEGDKLGLSLSIKEVTKPKVDIKQIPTQSPLSPESKSTKYKTTVNIQDKNDLNYLRQILGDDRVKDIQAGKMTDWRGTPYEDIARVNIISKTPQTIEQQLAGKITDVKLKSDTFYHGTSSENAKGILTSGFKKGSELPEDIFRGGGYGKIQNSISFAETPKEASIFSTLTKNGEIIEAKLKPNSKVVSIKGIEDANDLDEFIPYLIKQKVDAVYIGGGEKELVVINNKAITPVKSVSPESVSKTQVKKVNINPIETVNNIKDVKNSLKNIKTEFENLKTELEGMSVVAQEKRAGLNVNNIAKLKRIYSRSSRLQEGDIETIRNSKHAELWENILEDVQIKYPQFNEEEAYDFALSLPTKTAETIKQSPEMKLLNEKKKKLNDYLELLKNKEKQLNITKDDELYKEWKDTLFAQNEAIKIVEVPRTNIPVGEGKIKASKLEARVTEQLDNLSQENIDKLGTATYNELNKKENIAKASEYVLNNPDDAIKILTGEIEAPKGILRNAIYVAMENMAKGDVELARRLASISSTRMGQELSILTELDKNSPVKIMRDIIKIKEAQFNKKYANKTIKEVRDKEVKSLKEKVKKPDKYDWNKFLDEIRC